MVFYWRISPKKSPLGLKASPKVRMNLLFSKKNCNNAKYLTLLLEKIMPLSSLQEVKIKNEAVQDVYEE
jgi:hypothetical protein